MDLTDTNKINEQFNNPESPQEEELSHSDKMIGVFTEPAKMFGQTALFPARNKDWVIPLLILFILIGVTRTISMMNEEVFLEAKQEQIDRIDKMVEDGTLTQEQGDEAINNVDQQMEMMKGPLGWVINIASVLIFGFKFFIIFETIKFRIIKFFDKNVFI